MKAFYATLDEYSIDDLRISAPKLNSALLHRHPPAVA